VAGRFDHGGRSGDAHDEDAAADFLYLIDDPKFNEGGIAARTAKHFGTRHFDWRLDSATAKSLLPAFLESQTPSIDGFNTFCVSKLAHDHDLKVVLSGLGGDELFGGYRSFQNCALHGSREPIA